MTHPIYLDYNGTTPHDPEVVAAMRPFLESEFGNPSSSHYYGIAPRQAVEKARQQVADLLGGQPQDIIFTSGGTESNNHAIIGTAMALRGQGNHIITTQIEHPAVLEVCRFLEGQSFQVTYLPVNDEGMVDPGQLEAAMRPETILITVMHANNEVGTIEPIAQIASVAREQGVVLHTDAAQSVGKIPVRVDELDVDLLSVAGHKLYAPKGIGALWVRQPLRPHKFCHGAGQERGWRAGTENVLEIVGLGQACAVAARNHQRHYDHMRAMRDRLHQGLTRTLGDTRLNGHPEKRLPNTLSISFRGLEANDLLEEIGLKVAASAGAACHADDLQISHVLQAMGVPNEWAKGTLRFSVGRMTTADEIDRATAIIVRAVNTIRQDSRM